MHVVYSVTKYTNFTKASFTFKMSYGLTVHILHDQPHYRVYPDILSLVGDHLSGNGCGSPNHT